MAAGLATPRSIALDTGYSMSRDFGRAVAKTIATGATHPDLTGMVKIFNSKKMAAERARGHKAIAESMQSAVLAEVSAISAKSRSMPRPGRLSGGLARAVSNPSFAVGDERGVSFLNRELMAREAAHWQRINFGTGALQSPAKVVKPRLGNRQLFDVTVRPSAVGGGGALKNPILPEGFFLDSDGWRSPNSAFRGESTGNPFRVKSGRRNWSTTTSPIRPQHFINAGLDRLNSDLPKVYRDLVQQFVKRGSGGRQTVSVRV